MRYLKSSGVGGKVLLASCAASLLALTSLSAQAEGDKDGAARKTEIKKVEATKVEPATNEPQLTTATFGDWVERCQRVGAAAAKICEVAQTIRIEGQNAPIAQLAIGRIDRDEPMRLTMVLPVNVTLSDIPKLRAGPLAFDLSWRRCVPGGCIADLALSEAELTSLRNIAAAGEIEFKTAQGQSLKFQASVQGLPQALDSLKRESVALIEGKLRP